MLLHFGLLTRALAQLRRPGHTPIHWIESHPERPKKATASQPARAAIPREKWTKIIWLNYIADKLVTPSMESELQLIHQHQQPCQVFTATVEDVLLGAMAPNTIFWQHQGLPSTVLIAATNPARA